MQLLWKNQSPEPFLEVQNKKPIDVGVGGLSASISTAGIIRSINTNHPKHGFITLTSMDQFPNDRWYESNFVRQYRRQIAESSSGFGVVPDGALKQQKGYYLDNRYPLFEYTLNGVDVKSIYYPLAIDGSYYLIHQLHVENKSDEEVSFPVKIGGEFSLNRCSYGQLTEGGPIQIPTLRNDLHVKDHHVSILNPSLSARADIFFYHNEQPLYLIEEKNSENKPVTFQMRKELTLKKEEIQTITTVYTITTDVAQETDITYQQVKHFLTKVGKEDNDLIKNNDAEFKHSTYVIKRNIEYILSCCSVPIDDEYVCVITDHQLLPLSWNRDSYYMIKLLLEAEKETESNLFKTRVQQTVKGHLLWMFEKAERPERYWGRAYLTNGYSKDKIFQLDQQCYPLLELCDYYQQFNDCETVKRVSPIVKEVLDMIMEHKDEEKWLFLTGETPADDKVEYPYHFSSQVLVWYTLQRLSELSEIIPFDDYNLAELAEKVKIDCLHSFIVNKNNTKLFAYLTDLKGNYQFYHDANDLPTVFAPIWGFCQATDEEWVNTMEFAFTTENQGGFYNGEFSGLGSVHTPHPWPLGDGQELLYSHLTNNQERKEKVWEKLRTLVQWDGLFSEAVNENTGQVESRHWFSWPGSFVSTVLLLVGRVGKS